jgi:hypothetical protein
MMNGVTNSIRELGTRSDTLLEDRGRKLICCRSRAHNVSTS